MSKFTPETSARPKRRQRLPGEPSRRNCDIYERHILGGETQQQLAAEFGISHQRVVQIAARVEGWLATHGDHPLAARMRLRTNRRWDDIWSLAIEGFDRSREDRVVRKERVVRGKGDSGETPLLHVTEITTRQQNGDPRLLALAVRVLEREDRRWQQTEPRLPAGQSRALAKLDQRVAALEKEGRETAAEKGNGPQGPSENPSALPQLPAPPLPPCDSDYVGERVDGGWETQRTSCASSTELKAESRSTRPHPNPLPKGEGAEASCASSGELDTIAGATRPYPNPLPKGDGVEARSEKEKDVARRLAAATYQPASWEDWSYVSEWQFDRISEMLKLRGDREGWKRRQRELRRDLPTIIRLEWPDIDDVPPGEPTAGDDSDHRAASLARKLAV